MPLNPDRLEKLREQNIEASAETLQRIDDKSRLGDIALSNIHDQVPYIAHSHQLDTITSLEMRAAFATTFIETNFLYDRISIKIPAPDTFAEHGFDFTRLAGIYETMQANGLLPQVIIAKADLTFEEAGALYDNLRTDSAIRSDLTKKRRPFVCSGKIHKDWSESNQAYQAPSPAVYTPSGAWTLRIIPGNYIKYHAEEADYFGRSSAIDMKTGLQHKHPSISEYLTMQACLIQANKSILDDNSTTWLYGPYFNGIDAVDEAV